MTYKSLLIPWKIWHAIDRNFKKCRCIHPQKAKDSQKCWPVCKQHCHPNCCRRSFTLYFIFNISGKTGLMITTLCLALLFIVGIPDIEQSAWLRYFSSFNSEWFPLLKFISELLFLDCMQHKFERWISFLARLWHTMSSGLVTQNCFSTHN